MGFKHLIGQLTYSKVDYDVVGGLKFHEVRGTLYMHKSRQPNQLDTLSVTKEFKRRHGRKFMVASGPGWATPAKNLRRLPGRFLGCFQNDKGELEDHFYIDNKLCRGYYNPKTKSLIIK